MQPNVFQFGKMEPDLDHLFWISSIKLKTKDFLVSCLPEILLAKRLGSHRIDNFNGWDGWSRQE
jgi:hypothetical protein